MPTIIRTKLYRPRVTSDLIPLVRTHQTLDHDLDRPLTLVCAPAGYGKTTLLSSWLANTPRPQAWLSLDSNDDDLVTFLAYFVMSIRTIFPDACSETVDLLDAATIPPQSVLSATLNNELDELADSVNLPAGQRFILALDDYHLINNQDIHQTLNDLLLHPPRSLHLILSTRYNPPLPLSVLRSHGQLVEIRANALRFTSDEITTFLGQAVYVPLDSQTITQIVDYSEGWVTSLRFIALALNSEGSQDGSTLELSTQNHYAMDYLLTEVLKRLPESTQAFLIETAVLDQLNGALCDALIGQETSTQSSQHYLEWLEQENIFIMALDNEGQWYRFHHLFQELLITQLQKRYSEQEIAALHSRASAWYADNNLIEAAIRHALAAGDQATAADLVESHRHDALNQEDWPRLVRWLEMLPRDLIDDRPGLLMLETWRLQNRWRYADMPAHLARIEAKIKQAPLPEPDQTYLRSEIDLMYSRLCYYGGDAAKALFLSKRALEQAPMAYSIARALCWMTVASALQLQGDIPGMQEALREGFKEAQFHGPAFSASLQITNAHLHMIVADLTIVSQAAAHLLKLGTEYHLTSSIAWANYNLGMVAYHSNNLTDAEKAYSKAMNYRHSAASYIFTHCTFGLASVYLAQGNGEKAWELIDDVFVQGWETGSNSVLDEVHAFQAYLSLRLGNKAEAERWAALYENNLPLVPQAPLHDLNFILIKILLNQATEDSLHEAANVLARLYEFAANTHNNRMLIEIYALQAIHHQLRGDEVAALSALEQSLALAEPGGFLRIFIDLGSELSGLLAKLAAQSTPSAFIDQIRRFMPGTSTIDLPHPDGNQSQSFSLANDQKTLVEPLTERELEILALLAQHLTAQEVAEKLTISPHTVKRHRANIYQTLSVNRLRDALLVAEKLDLLNGH